MAGCGKADNNGRVVTGSALLCGTKLTFGTGKEPRRTEVHLCGQCSAKTNTKDSERPQS
jgi:hypothetical protein